MEMGGIGVYGQGAEVTVIQVPDPRQFAFGTAEEPSHLPPLSPVPSGPEVPAAGVLGRGGVPIPRHGAVAAGVIGLAGDRPIPDFAETGDTGVYGAGPKTGVFGHGSFGVYGQTEDGAGVYGYASAGGRGGRFQSERSAQVQLMPRLVRGPFPTTVPANPREIPTGPEGVTLPKEGQGGDLLTLMDNQRQCNLWFCVHGSEGKDVPAQWAQVLLGTPMAGRD
jgi:hypothetical protein